MDKRVILATAGSGKTAYIIEQLSLEKKALIITYTENNIQNLRSRIIEKFNFFPENITLMTYFSFLYSFCFRPFLSYKFKTKGINYKPNLNKFAKESNDDFFVDKNKRLYSNRIAKCLENRNVIQDVKSRLEKYFDSLFIDEVQDLSGNDFNFLKSIANANIEILFVGDFYQHTFDTSRDGGVNKNLHKNLVNYKKEFSNMGLTVDVNTLIKSYRCSPTICDFLTKKLKIEIESHKTNDTAVDFIDNEEKVDELFHNNDIVKLYYKEHYKYNGFSNNWGKSKGENNYNDVCVVMNENTYKLYSKGELDKLAPTTKNKFYVACTRTNSNLYLIPEKLIIEYKQS